MPIYSRYISSVGAGIQSINGSVVGAQQIVGTGDVNVNTVTGTGVTTISLSTPLSTFANTSLSNLVAPTAVNVPLLGTLGSDTAPAYSFTGDTNTGMFSSGADTLNITTGGTERMRITASGDVGINNTTAPRQLTIQNTTASQPATLGLLNTTNLGLAGAAYESGTIDFLTTDILGGLTSPVALAKIASIADNAASSVPSGSLAFFTNREGVNQTQDPIERMRIDSSGNVLIGTTDASVYTAGALLKVASSSVSNNARMEIRGSTTTDQAALDLGAGAQRNGVIAGQDQSLLFLTNSAAGTSSVAERMRIDGAGNVGIGTTTPSQKLSVNGSVSIQQNNVQTNLLVQAGTPYNAQTLVNFYLGASNSTAVNNGTAYRWLFGVEGVATGKALTFSSETNTGVTERMRIDSGGNVGIGTTTPGAKLEIAGDIEAGTQTTGTLGSLMIRSRESTDRTRASMGTLRSSGAPYIGNNVEPSSTVADEFNAGLTGTNTAGALVLRNDELKFFNFRSGSMTKGSPLVMKELFEINTIGSLLSYTVDGNGGLHRITSTAQGSTFGIVRQNGTSASPTALTSGDFIGQFQCGGYDGTGTQTNQVSIAMYATENWSSIARGTEIRLNTTPIGSTTITERMRITSNGDVGIGTTTPTNKLDIGVTAANNNSGIEITNTNSAGYGGCLSFAHRSTSGGPVAVRSQITSEGGGNNSFMRFFTTLSNLATEKMRLTGEGNVGIGATSPQTRLEVRSPSGYTVQRLVTLSRQEPTRYNAYMEFGTTTGSDFHLVIGTRNNNVDFPGLRLRDGNVGVQTFNFGAGGPASVFAIANGTEPSTSVNDQIAMGSVDLTAGNTIPYIRSEGTGMTGAGITNTAVTHKIAIKVNGTVYYLLATTDGT